MRVPRIVRGQRGTRPPGRASLTYGLPILLGLAAACGESEVEADPPGPCVDPAEVYAFPHPQWTTAGDFAPPEGDRVAGLLLDGEHPWPEWHAELGQAAGWTRRPLFAIPLSAQGATVEATGLALVGREGRDGEWRALEVGLTPTIEGSTLLVHLDRPLPPGINDSVFVLASAALAGAEARPICGDDGTPHPDYAAALAELPAAVQSTAALALPWQAPDLHLPLARLAAVIDATALQVAEIEALALADFGVGVSASVAANVRDPAAAGILDLPDYRDETGALGLDAEGTPVAGGRTYPGFIVLLPQNGTPPFPLVMFQHGGESSKEDGVILAGPLAAAGFALIAIDLVHHGDRATGGSSFLTFIDFESTAATRENFRQTSADQMAVLAGVESLNAALAPVVGIDRALDPDRLFYTGASLGAVTGSMTFTTFPSLRAAGLFVGGAGYAELGSHSVFSLMLYRVLGRPPLERDLTLAMMEILLGPADPFAYALHAEDRSSTPRPLLLMQADSDAIVAAAATEQLARAFGAELARPYVYPVDGLSTTDLPAQDNFAWSAGGDGATRLLMQFPMAEIPPNDHHRQLAQQVYAQELLAHCFTTVLAGGACEAIDNGFAER